MYVRSSVIVLLLLATTTYAADLACTDCHNPSGVPVPHDSGCRNTSCLQSCHSIDLNLLAHLSGPGTPFTGDRTTTCNTCHNGPFEGVYHPYSINVSAGSLTLPGVVDLDQACGQCHGGGTAQASTTGSIAAGTRVLTVASITGFVPGGRVVIAGAGTLGADGITRGDFESFIESILGNQLTLTGDALGTVSGAAVVQNPTKNGAMYRSKARLAPIATGIHDGAGVNYPVTFSYTVTPNTLTVNVDAQVSCGGPCPTFTYDWDWGDSTTNGSADPDTHTYAVSGTKSIMLTVYLSGKKVSSAIRSLTLAEVDLPPTASGTCTWTANTWTMTVLDTSTDTDATGVQAVNVEWGDSSARSLGSPGALFSHTYVMPGTYTVTQKAIDSAQKASAPVTCPSPATPTYFTISGTVRKRDGTTALPSAIVTVLKGTTAVKTVYTASNGTFSAGSLKPGTYALRVTKSGYTFATPAATITVGPSSTGIDIRATRP